MQIKSTFHWNSDKKTEEMNNNNLFENKVTYSKKINDFWSNITMHKIGIDARYI